MADRTITPGMGNRMNIEKPSPPTLEIISEKLETVLHVQGTTADEVQRLGRVQTDTSARIAMVEEALGTAAATARVAIETALAVKADRDELRASMQGAMRELSSGIAMRMERLEKVVATIGTRNAEQVEALEQTLGETRLQTPMIRGVQGRTARSAAWASAFGTGFAYTIAELIRHFWH
jgi:hypothetical protein